MYSAWKKEDDPPSRVEPVLMLILLRAAELAGLSARDQATIDCIWMAFYFLLCPGEYVNPSGDAKHPYRLEDVEFKVGLSALEAPWPSCLEAWILIKFASLVAGAATRHVPLPPRSRPSTHPR